MSDFIFKILCQCLYDDMFCDEGFSMYGEENIELENILVEQFKTDPDHYSEILRENKIDYFEEYWRWLIYLNRRIR